MNTTIKIFIGIAIIVIFFILGYFGQYILGTSYYLDNRPECYLLTGSQCMNGYDLVELQGAYWSLIPMKQCCLRPHYLLQTNEPTLFTLKNFCEKVMNTSYVNITDYSISKSEELK